MGTKLVDSKLLHSVVGQQRKEHGGSEVVFDGADVGPVAGGGRDAGVSVRFSPEGVEADDAPTWATRPVWS